jgi:predicted  nucleic acid-binding Zn-ribbon protein
MPPSDPRRPLNLAAQYEVLGALKRVDDQLVRVLSDLAKLPEERAQAKGRLAEAESAFQAAKERFQDFEKRARQAELAVKEKEDFLRKAEAKLMDVKTNDEYRAALREVENHKKEKDALEEQALELLTELDKHRAAFQADEAKFQEAKGVHGTLMEKLAADEAMLEKSRGELLRQREELAGRLDDQTASLFRKLSSRMRGAVITAVDNAGCCTSCHMQIRPQAYNEIVGHQAVHTCGSCGKILVPQHPVPSAEARS